MATWPLTYRLQEYARHRRAVQRWRLLWSGVVVLVAAPLSAVLTPLVFLVAALAVRAVDLALPIPDAVYETLRGAAAAAPAGLEVFTSRKFATVATRGRSHLLEIPVLPWVQHPDVYPGGIAEALAVWAGSVLAESACADSSSGALSRNHR